MLSMILSHANSNEISFAGLKDIAVFQPCVGTRFFAVDADAALVDQPAGIASAFAKTGLNNGRDKARRVVDHNLADGFGYLAFAKPCIEVRLRSEGRVLAMQPLDQPPGQRRFRVPRL